MAARYVEKKLKGVALGRLLLKQVLVFAGCACNEETILTELPSGTEKRRWKIKLGSR